MTLPPGNDPTAAPVVAPDLLADAREEATLVACMRTLQAVTSTFPHAFEMAPVAPAGGAPVDDALSAG